MGTASHDGWRGFQGDGWRDTIDVSRFIHENLRPYDGGPEFLAGPTDRTARIWRQLQRMFVEERRRGIYDVDAHTPSTITSHAPGYLDKDHELIVGLQTTAPLRPARQPPRDPTAARRPADHRTRARGGHPARRDAEGAQRRGRAPQTPRPPRADQPPPEPATAHGRPLRGVPPRRERRPPLAP